jgi:hypothetical protein
MLLHLTAAVFQKSIGTLGLPRVPDTVIYLTSTLHDAELYVRCEKLTPGDRGRKEVRSCTQRVGIVAARTDKPWLALALGRLNAVDQRR